jgi:hypothetical protein
MNEDLFLTTMQNTRSDTIRTMPFAQWLPKKSGKMEQFHPATAGLRSCYDASRCTP